MNTGCRKGLPVAQILQKVTTEAAATLQLRLTEIVAISLVVTEVN